MRFNDIVDPNLLKSPQMAQYEKEDELLSHFLLDITLIDDLKSNLHKIG